MRKPTAAGLLLAMTALILDSRCAAGSAQEAIELCIGTLIPVLFPLFVLSAMLVPALGALRMPRLSKILGFPEGGGGLFLIGCAGGFPVGAACVAQAARDKLLSREMAGDLLGLCSFCGPSFLFGVIGNALSLQDAAVLFLIQLETALLIAVFRRRSAPGSFRSGAEAVILPLAVRRAISSIATVCAWVILAGVAAGFLRRWLFPLLPKALGIFLTGILELTNGVFALEGLSPGLRLPFCAFFVTFGGVSVLLQIAAVAAPAGLRMGKCIRQKTVQALLAAAIAILVQSIGPWAMALPLPVLIPKIAVEISRGVCYDKGRKEGITNAVSQKDGAVLPLLPL